MKNKHQLTYEAMTRLAARAVRLLSLAQLELDEMPKEFGCPVAEDFAEGAIESAAEALAILARIKCSLRVERVEHEKKTGEAVRATTARAIPVPMRADVEGGV